MKSKLIHNISSYTLTQTEERLLCRGWDFCIEDNIKNFLDFETDLELNAMKIQSHCHESVFKLNCRNIHNASQQLMSTSKHKKIRNLSDEELVALKSLKSNKSIVICKADKGEQFQLLNNDKCHRERETELNKYIFSLVKDVNNPPKTKQQQQQQQQHTPTKNKKTTASTTTSKFTCFQSPP
ncbi:unnamed protein product [Rotaria sordida]|uniref:Uncharacterized protein n=1 Tax=Rotaria sordida TaxID=392033 RepID=A0A819QUE8_9BILA|nr:unnamed protein product [Rotaria sordida]